MCLCVNVLSVYVCVNMCLYVNVCACAYMSVSMYAHGFCILCAELDSEANN